MPKSYDGLKKPLWIYNIFYKAFKPNRDLAYAMHRDGARKNFKRWHNIIKFLVVFKIFFFNFLVNFERFLKLFFVDFDGLFCWIDFFFLFFSWFREKKLVFFGWFREKKIGFLVDFEKKFRFFLLILRDFLVFWCTF